MFVLGYYVWNDLKNTFAQGELTYIFELHMDVATLLQGDLFVTEYFIKLCVL